MKFENFYNSLFIYLPTPSNGKWTAPQSKFGLQDWDIFIADTLEMHLRYSSLELSHKCDSPDMTNNNYTLCYTYISTRHNDFWNSFFTKSVCDTNDFIGSREMNPSSYFDGVISENMLNFSS